MVQLTRISPPDHTPRRRTRTRSPTSGQCSGAHPAGSSETRAAGSTHSRPDSTRLTSRSSSRRETTTARSIGPRPGGMAKWRVGNPRTSPSSALSRRVTRISFRPGTSSLRTRMRSPASGQYSGLQHTE